jgi:hypothetical protein
MQNNKLDLKIERKQVMLVITAVLLMVSLCLGFGYFFGRYHQVLLNKARLDVIPDVNCGKSNVSLHRES